MGFSEKSFHSTYLYLVIGREAVLLSALDLRSYGKIRLIYFAGNFPFFLPPPRKIIKRKICKSKEQFYDSQGNAFNKGILCT